MIESAKQSGTARPAATQPAIAGSGRLASGTTMKRTPIQAQDDAAERRPAKTLEPEPQRHDEHQRRNQRVVEGEDRGRNLGATSEITTCGKTVASTPMMA